MKERVLVVDDEPDIRELVQEILEDEDSGQQDAEDRQAVTTGGGGDAA